jgi:hypothetical protein
LQPKTEKIEAGANLGLYLNKLLAKVALKAVK